MVAVFAMATMIMTGFTAGAQLLIDSSADVPMVRFAAERWTADEYASNITARVIRENGHPDQGFTVERTEPGGKDANVWIVRATDDHGLMYGLLDLSESLRLGSPPAKTSAPSIHRRGLKFNIPLDARSPSYDDSGTSAVRNIPEMWDLNFWVPFLDAMAEHRYNVLTLWCNHPFTTMVILDDYPDVALPDVAIPTYEMDDHMLIQYRKAELRNPEHYEIVRTMTMEEKVSHWQQVMRHARERGIDIYFIAWNIWLHGAEGQYGITDDQTNEATIAYLRASMREMVLTYPDLRGFGITAGENMHNDLDESLQEDYGVEPWLWRTYGEGIVDALTELADRGESPRDFHFIHRVWYTGLAHMHEHFLQRYPGRIDVSFKYARARLYAMTDPPFFNQQLRDDVERFDQRCWMNLRNDDLFNFRWGDPDYVRDFLGNLPPEPTLAGFYMGSDGYVWGREFTSTAPATPRQLEIDKHWYRFMLWGRLAYDPSLDRRFFEAQLAERFPEVDAAQLYDTWQVASQIVPLINRAHWRDWDHMWSVETCMSKKEGYHSVDHFIEFGPFPGRDLRSIPEYVTNPNAPGQSPFDVANQLDALSQDTLTRITALRDADQAFRAELQQTLSDQEAFAHLAAYYADKLRGATEVHRYRVHGDEAAQAQAISHLEAALIHWEHYGTVAASLYEVQLLARVSTTDWRGTLLDHARADIEMARNAQPGAFPESVMHSNLPQD